MKIEKLTGNAFIANDLPDAPCATGVVRVAPKVLQGGAKAMARTTTYMFAIRELQIGGASAGISAEPADVDAAVAAFLTAVADRTSDGRLVLDAGKGVSPEMLDTLASGDPRPAVHRELDDQLLGVGAVAAAVAALGRTDGWTASVEPGPTAESTLAALAEAGVVDPSNTIDADVDVLFCGTRQGVIDGTAAETLAAKIVVPIGPHAVSAKGLATLGRRDVVVLPDFITLAGPSYAGWPVGDATGDAIIDACRAGVAALISEAVEHPEGPFLGACYTAEAFLSSWQDELPFGRPLA